jgi:3-oxoacyl-(acyl-carrier-protein) synthase
MTRGIAKLVGGVVAMGIAIFAAIAAAGLAGDGFEEALSGPEKSGSAEALRKAS